MNLSLTKKLVSSFTIIAMSTFIIAAIGIYALLKIDKSTYKLANKNIPAVGNIVSVKTDLDELTVAQRTLMSTELTKEQYNKLMNDIANARNKYTEHFKIYSSLVEPGSEKDKIFKDYVTKVSDWKKSNEKFEELRTTIQELDLGDPKSFAQILKHFAETTLELK